MNKVELRRLWLPKRRDMLAGEIASASAAIYERFFQSTDLSEVEVLHTFIPMNHFGEVDTLLILRRLWADFPEVKTAVPKTDLSAGTLDHFIIEPETEYALNSWGVPEPAGGLLVVPEKIDVVLVPLIVFDTRGHRVGYGKGFYDRFLAECRSDCLKVGVSIFPPIEKIEDTNEFDVRLDRCLTPNRTYEF